MIEGYLTCPRQYYHMRVAKDFKQEDNADYLDWGIAVHTAFERNLLYGEPFEEPRFSSLIPIAEKLDRLPGDHYGEQKLGIDINMQPVDFWSQHCWIRVIVDRLVIHGRTALPFDYKTGKRKPYSRQLELITGVLFNWFDVDISHTAYLWTQGGLPTSATYTRDNMQKYWDGFKKNIEDMEWSYANNAWPAIPSGLCGPGKKAGSTYKGCPVLSCPHNRRPDAWKGRKSA
jgi:hypothetical protein